MSDNYSTDRTLTFSEREFQMPDEKGRNVMRHLLHSLLNQNNKVETTIILSYLQSNDTALKNLSRVLNIFIKNDTPELSLKDITHVEYRDILKRWHIFINTSNEYLWPDEAVYETTFSINYGYGQCLAIGVATSFFAFISIFISGIVYIFVATLSIIFSAMIYYVMRDKINKKKLIPFRRQDIGDFAYWPFVSKQEYDCARVP